MGSVVSSIVGYVYEPIVSMYKNVMYNYDNGQFEIITPSIPEHRLEINTKPLDQKELEEVIKRTSLESIVGTHALRTKKRRVINTKTNDIPECSTPEKSYSLEMDDGNTYVPDEFQDYIYHVIENNETLEGIALKYSIRVSELRIANKIRNNQDFYAKETLIIPSKNVSNIFS